MAGQGRALVILGGLLAAGIGVAVWAMSSETTSESPHESAPDAGSSSAPDAGGKTPAAGPKRPKPKGTASVVGEIRRSKGKVPVPDQEVQLVPEKGDPWTVKTDARGAFKLLEIPHGGPYELRVAAAGCGTIRIPGMALDRNEKRDVGTLWLDPSVSVTVQVRAWSDEPVAGAVVEAFAVPTMDNFDWSKALAQMNQVPVAVAKATTDAKGEATFAEMAVGRWQFAATKDGFGRAGRGTSLRSDMPPSPVKLYLGTGFPLTGRVFDAAKNPVAGAQVQAGPMGSPWDVGSSALRARTTTDDQGRYAFAALDGGDAQLLVGRPGGVPSSVAMLKIPNVKQFDVYLKGTATLTGTVTEKDAGKPVEGATVRATTYGGMGMNSPGEGVTDAEGKYSIPLTAGTINSVVAEKDGWANGDDPMKAQQPMQLREGESQTRDLKLRPASKVVGVVKGPDGPLSGVKVNVQTGSQSGGWSSKAATTDSDGKYECGSLAPGKAVVRADVAGYYVKDFPENYWMLLQSSGTSPFKIDVPEGATVTKDIEMVRGSAVEGRVEGPDGALAGVRVTLPQDYEGGVFTGADGAFRIEGAKPAATVSLYLFKEGYVGASSNKPFAVTAEAPTTGLLLRMQKLVVVKGTVTSADGAPLHDGKVVAASWNDNGQMVNSPQPVYYGGYGMSGGSGASAPIRPDGTYEVTLTGPAGNKLRVTASALEKPSATSEPMTMSDGQSEYVVNVNLDGGKDLEGKVVAKPGGAPVAGALISLAPRSVKGGGSMGQQYFDGMSYGGRGGGQSVWAVTDAEGRWAVGHLMPGTYSVLARADGYVPGSAQADLATSAPVTIEIEPELTIEGIVTLGDGSPVEGAQVGAAQDKGGTDGSDKMRPPRMVDGSGGSGGTSASTVSGRGGSFRLQGLASGNYRITVSAARQMDLNIKTKRTDPVVAGSKDLKIVVEAGGVISGRILDPQKKPVVGAWVHANPEANNGKRVEGAESRSVRAKDDGTFSVVGLSDVTTYSLMIQAGQGWDLPGAAALKNQTMNGVAVGSQNLEILLEEGLSITGVVVDGDGKPIANAYLYCMGAATGESKQRQNRNAMTDQNGAFTIGGLDAGDCQFTLQAMGGPNTLILQNGDKVAAGSRDVRLVATKGLTITGVVVDELGAPVKGATLNAAAKAGGRGGYGRTDDEGKFEITGLVANVTYTINANAMGRARGKAEEVVAGATNVRIVSPRGFEASGRVVDEKGAALKGGQIYAHLTTDQSVVQFAQVDETGAFTLKGLIEGSYEVMAMPKGATSGYKKCGTLKSGDTSVELRLEP